MKNGPPSDPQLSAKEPSWFEIIGMLAVICVCVAIVLGIISILVDVNKIDDMQDRLRKVEHDTLQHSLDIERIDRHIYNR